MVKVLAKSWHDIHVDPLIKQEQLHVSPGKPVSQFSSHTVSRPPVFRSECLGRQSICPWLSFCCGFINQCAGRVLAV